MDNTFSGHGNNGFTDDSENSYRRANDDFSSPRFPGTSGPAYGVANSDIELRVQDDSTHGRPSMSTTEIYPERSRKSEQSGGKRSFRPLFPYPRNYGDLTSKPSSSNETTDRNNTQWIKGEQYDPAKARPRPKAQRQYSAESNQDQPHVYVNAIENEENMPFPVEISFIDRKSGIEYAADGQPSMPPSPSKADYRPQMSDQPLQAASLGNSSYQPDQQYRRSQPFQSGHPNQPGQQYHPDPPSYQPVQSYQTGQPYQPGQPNQPVISRQPWAGNQVFGSGDVTVPRTQQNSQISVGPQDVKDYSTLSWLVCLLFCMPIGLYSISRSREARRLKEHGRYTEAKDVASTALCCNVTGIVGGILAITGIIIFNLYRTGVL